MNRLTPLLLLATAALIWASDDKPPETNAKWVAENYTKFEHMIPMRDGVRLFTCLYVPKDDSGTWPILLTRTPYSAKFFGAYGGDNYTRLQGPFEVLARDKFILVLQDVRGRFASEGVFEQVRPYRGNKGPKDTDESTDAWDTIDWLVKNTPGNNGKVGIFGISYPGFYTLMGMIDSHPALKAASPQAPVTDWFVGDDIHHNGALFLVQNFEFMTWFYRKVDDPLHDTIPGYSYPTQDGYDFFLRMGPLANSRALASREQSNFWNEILDHPDYDSFWQARDIRPHLKNIHCAVMTVGGWYDAEDFFGTLEAYHRTGQQNPGIDNTIVIGPWYHTGWAGSPGDKLGDIDFHAETARFYREHIELPFFRRYLKGDTSFTPPKAYVFETGTDRWRKFDAWPPKEALTETFYFRADGGLAFAPPLEKGEAFDEFVSDPAKPVPFTMHRSTSYPKAYPVEDQSFATSRPDVLSYSTPALDEDVTLAGPLVVTLYVSTTGTDADWITKLIDVYAGDVAPPDPNPTDVVLAGYQQLVRGDVMRGRFRNSYEKPEPFTPGQVTKVEFTMPDVCHTFRRGHRIMVQVQSSWFPLVDRNPQTFVDIAKARPEDFERATQRVYRSIDTPSSIAVLALR